MRLMLTCIAILIVVACGSTLENESDGGPMASDTAVIPPRDWPLAEVPASREVEPGIERDVLRIEVPAAPPNPTTGDETPTIYNQVQIVRFRSSESADARAIVMAMPGTFGGGASFEHLARHLVRRSLAAEAPVEVWALDRRANLLEDLRGFDAAEAMQEPDVAIGYYFEGETVGGEAFEGVLAQSELPFASEWGLATTIQDLRSVIERVPDEARDTRVFLMGHSIGASILECFAAWRFEDGVFGRDLMAGMILVDGSSFTEPLSEEEYLTGAMGPFGPTPGVEAIRSTNRYGNIPLLGVEVYLQAEIAALNARYRPDAIPERPLIRRVIATLLSLPLGRIPAMSNEAIFGFGFDYSFNGLPFAAVSLGQHLGGPVEEYENTIFGRTLLRPSDPDATYTWVDALESDPPEFTPMGHLIDAWVEGRTNYAEWYFPNRLPLDLAAVGDLSWSEESWQLAYGLRALDSALVTSPILFVPSGLSSVEGASVLQERYPSAASVEVVDATSQSHLDPLLAADNSRNPVPERVVDFLLREAASGSIRSPLP